MTLPRPRLMQWSPPRLVRADAAEMRRERSCKAPSGSADDGNDEPLQASQTRMVQRWRKRHRGQGRLPEPPAMRQLALQPALALLRPQRRKLRFHDRSIGCSSIPWRSVATAFARRRSDRTGGRSTLRRLAATAPTGRRSVSTLRRRIHMNRQNNCKRLLRRNCLQNRQSYYNAKRIGKRSVLRSPRRRRVLIQRTPVIANRERSTLASHRLQTGARDRFVRNRLLQAIPKVETARTRM